MGTVKPFFLVTATWLAKVAATSLDTATSVAGATGGSDKGTTIKTQLCDNVKIIKRVFTLYVWSMS